MADEEKGKSKGIIVAALIAAAATVLTVLIPLGVFPSIYTPTPKPPSLLEERVNEAVRKAEEARLEAYDAKAFAENTTRSDYGVYPYSEGDIYAGQIHNGKRNGYGVNEWPDGMTYAGEWQNGKRNGYGVNKWPDGKKYAGEYKNDKRNGCGILYGKNGNVISRGLWANGELVDEVK